MAGLMTLEMGDTDKHLQEHRRVPRARHRILPPDVNESSEDFTVLRPDAQGHRPIRFGLGAVRGVGSKAIESDHRRARRRRPFTSLADFCKRVQGSR